MSHPAGAFGGHGKCPRVTGTLTDELSALQGVADIVHPEDACELASRLLTTKAELSGVQDRIYFDRQQAIIDRLRAAISVGHVAEPDGAADRHSISDTNSADYSFEGRRALENSGPLDESAITDLGVMVGGIAIG